MDDFISKKLSEYRCQLIGHLLMVHVPLNICLSDDLVNY